VGEPSDSSTRDGRRAPVGLVVRLSYPSLDVFAERHAVNISRGGLFIRTREPKAVGTLLAFELRLAGGEVAIRGQGVVRWIQPEEPAARPPKAPGMGIQFTGLDPPSRALVERMVAGQERRGAAPGAAGPAPEAERPAVTPPPTRAPSPVIPGPPLLAPAPPAPPAAPALADLEAPHQVEQLAAGPLPVDLPLPREAAPPGRPSRAVIGIDLGTTNSCAAVVKDGRPYVIPSREGHATVPSIVALNSRNAIVVGHLARAQLLVNPRETVSGAKRLIGRRFDSAPVQEIRAKYGYQVVADADGMAAVRLGPATLSLEQVSALVLREVREVAQNHLGEEVNRAVITVPAYYDERQRQAVRQAGALAGLRVERILNEPTAAALAYAYGRHLNQRVMVYDLGGGTFDASVLELQDNVYEVVSTGGDPFLGGVDFDQRIVDVLLQRYQAQAGLPFAGDRVALSRLADAAERAKCALSERTDFQVQLPYLAMLEGRPFALDTALSRPELEELVGPLVDRTVDVCREVLLAKGLSPPDIDEVILVGGQSRMPLVHARVAELFGRPPSRAVHPDEAVAIGAALLAHSLERAEGVVLIDVLPMSIGIGLPGGKIKTIIERNTPLPARKQYGLATTRDGQTEFELVVLQGDSEHADGCTYLGTLSLTGLPRGPRGMIKIAVTFELGAECLLTVTAREMNTGRQVQARMSARDTREAVREKLEASGAAGEAQRLATGTFPLATAPPGTGPAPPPDPAGAPAEARPDGGQPAQPAAPGAEDAAAGFWAMVRRLLSR
jgi:molecular chaperone DnaK